MAAICSGSLSFVFNEAAFTPEEMAAIERSPNLIDPYGGAKMRLIRKTKKMQSARSLKQSSRKSLQLKSKPKVKSSPIDTNADEDNLPRWKSRTWWRA